MGNRVLAFATTVSMMAACGSTDPDNRNTVDVEHPTAPDVADGGSSASRPSGEPQAQQPAVSDAATPEPLPTSESEAGPRLPDGSNESSGCPTTPPVGAPFVHEGDLLVSDAASIAAAWSVTEITGNLELPTTATDLSHVSLPNLRRVGGDLNAHATAFERLHFPNLEEIGGRLYLDANLGLVRTDFRSLTRAGGVFVVRNLFLQTVGLGALRETGSLQFNSNPLVDCLGPVSVGGEEPQGEFLELETDVDGQCLQQCGRWVHESVGLAGVLTDLDDRGPPEVRAEFDLSAVVDYPDVPAIGDLEFPESAAPENLRLVGSTYLQYPDRYGPFVGHWLAAVRNDGDDALCELHARVELRDAGGNSLFSGDGLVHAPLMQTASGSLSGCLTAGEVGLVAVLGDPITAAEIAELHFGFRAQPEPQTPTPLDLGIEHAFSDGLRPSVRGAFVDDAASGVANWRVDVFAMNARGIPIGHSYDDPDPGPVLGAGNTFEFTVPLFVNGTEFVVFPTPRP